jgi:flagella basal body P-ring formation protein FlgA
MPASNRLRIAIIILIMQLSAGVGYGITIRFHGKAIVSKPIVQLGDIAEITGAAPETVSIYASAKLVPSPPIGGQRLLDFDAIRGRLIALGLSTGEIEFTGHSRVVVENPGGSATVDAAMAGQSIRADNQNLSAASLQMVQAERIALQAVRGELASRLDAAELALAELQSQIPLQQAFHFRGSSASDWQVAGWSPQLEQAHQLVLTKKQWSPSMEPVRVNCAIKMPPRALTVKQIIPAGHVVTPADLDWVYSKTPDGQTQMENIVGMEAQRPLRPGAPIREDDLRKKVYVRARDLVTVSARQGGITVKRTMRALGTGGLGETVTFTALNGNDRFPAKVTGYHEAEAIESSN